MTNETSTGLAVDDETWRQRAKEAEAAKPAMGIEHLTVDSGRLISGENTVHKDGLALVPVASIYARAYYNKPYNAANRGTLAGLPVCYSTSEDKEFDVTPEANSPERQNENCATCPLGSWDKSTWEPGQRAPKCGTRRNTLLKSLDTGKVYRFSIPPTAVKVFDDYWRSLTGPLSGSLVLLTADGRVPAFKHVRDLDYTEFSTKIAPFIQEANDVLRQPINYEAVKKDGASPSRGPGGNEAPIEAPTVPQADGPKKKSKLV